MGANLSLKVECDRNELDRITEALEELGVEEAWPPDLLFKLNLVIEELVLNVIDYGYPGDGSDSDIDLTVTSNAESVTIEITDDGVAFDPVIDARAPDVSAPIEDRPVGGLGIYLARKLMDEFKHRREDGRNYLVMIANRTV